MLTKHTLAAHAAGSSVPDKYLQPDRLDGRRVEGALESVDFVPAAHVRLWYNNQNESYELHHHSAMEIIWCREHAYHALVGDQEYLMQPGDFLFIPPYMLHELCPVDGGCRFICLFDSTPLHEFADYQVVSSLFASGYFLNAAVNPALYAEITQLFEETIDAYFANKMLWESTVYIRLAQILVRIGRAHFRAQAELSGTPENAVREEYETIGSLLTWLDTHYHEDIALEDAARMSGFSKYYFTRLFKQITDTTFGDYLARKRVTAAQSMLSGQDSITDIAFRCGFNNLTTFNRCFRKYANCSPSDYRSRLRSERIAEAHYG